MRPHRTDALGLCLAGAALLATLAAAASPEDEPAPPAQGTSSFGDVVDVQLVNVEVWVTDRKGRPVTGLEPSDFEVFEDGEPVVISHFASLHGAAPGALAENGGIAPLALPEEPAAEPAPAEPAFDPGHLVIYFDEYNLGLQSRKRVLEDLEAFLATEDVPPERIMVLRQGDNLVSEALFGSSAVEVAAALERLAEPRASSTQFSREKDLAIELLKNSWRGVKDLPSPCRMFVPSALADVESYAAVTRARVQSTLEHLAEVARFLAGVPGVKTLVYLSDAMELRTGADLVAFVDQLCPLKEMGWSAPTYSLPAELGTALDDLTQHANSNRVTFYAIQSSGLRPDSFFSAENSAQSRAEISAARTFSRERRTNDRDGLVTLAHQTGGRAIFNLGRFDEELGRISDEMTSYYSLAYVPPHGGDGAAHKIKVRLKDAKGNVRHRLGYRDKSPDERMTERLYSALYLGQMENPLAARLGAGTVRAKGDGDLYTLPLHVMVPVERLVFLPGAQGELAELRVRVATRDHAGRVDVQEKLFRTARPPEETGLVDLVVDVELEEGAHVVAVGLRDEASRETSYVATAVAIQDPEASLEGGQG